MNISEKDLLKSMVENIDELPDIKKRRVPGICEMHPGYEKKRYIKEDCEGGGVNVDIKTKMG